MCNSWAVCTYQTLWKNLTGNQTNQIKKLTELILRLFCLVMTLSYSNNKKNMMNKKNCNVNHY